MTAASPAPLPRRADFPWYLASASLALAGMSLQGFLIPWLLVFTLQADAMEFGVSRALMELPPIVELLVGGAYADRLDGRRLLLLLSFAAGVPPLLVAATLGHLGYWVVIAYGALVAALQSAGEPARSAMLSRVARIDIQRAVAAMTVVTTAVGLAAVWVAGRIEALGLATILLAQAALFALAGLAIARLPPAPPTATSIDILGGLRALRQARLVRNVIALNFASALFNAGGYVVVVPLVVSQVYAGDAAFLAATMIAFTIGSSGSNVLLFLLMPLRRPGRVFLLLQLTRAALLLALWFEPPAWLFYALICAWGVNMGVTTTLARAAVQELAPAPHLAKILSLLFAGFLIAAPASALVLGFVVAISDAPSGLLPGIAASLCIFAAGAWKSGLWQFESPSFPKGRRRLADRSK